MCRHTVGLNYTAIGIEHVGMSDAQVMGDRRQLAASLRLTRALQGRYGIATRNVIGHNESLSSPYHREHVARLRTQTHADFPKPVMDGYRRMLGRLPAPGEPQVGCRAVEKRQIAGGRARRRRHRRSPRSTSTRSRSTGSSAPGGRR